MGLEIVSTENVCDYESVVLFSRMEMLKISRLVFQQTAYQEAKDPCFVFQIYDIGMAFFKSFCACYIVLMLVGDHSTLPSEDPVL